MSFQERFATHVHDMQQAVDENYNWKVVNTLSALVECYEFVHAKEWLSDALAADAPDTEGGEVGWSLGRGAAVVEATRRRRAECKERTMLLARDIISTVGVAREQTYVHDLVYGVHLVFDTVLHPLLAGMQGVEHVNKAMKLCLVSQCIIK